MLTALKQHQLSLVWPLLFEKQIGTTMIGCQFGGSAWLTDNGRINVKMKLYKEPRYKSNKHSKIKNYTKLIWYTISFNKEKKMRMKIQISLERWRE